HSVDERLDADEAGARMLLGLRDHMLATAESDLAADAVDRSGEHQRAARGRRPGKFDGKPWQWGDADVRLARPQRMTLAMPEKGAAPSLAAIGYGHGGLDRRHGGRAALPRRQD